MLSVSKRDVKQSFFIFIFIFKEMVLINFGKNVVMQNFFEKYSFNILFYYIAIPCSLVVSPGKQF